MSFKNLVAFKKTEYSIITFSTVASISRVGLKVASHTEFGVTLTPKVGII